MKLYQLVGFDYDVQDCGKSVVAEVFSTREEAERSLQGYQKGAQMLISSWKEIDCRESVLYKHGELAYYSLIFSFNIEDEEQRRAWLTYLTDDNIKYNQVKWNDDMEDTYREYDIISLSIKEIEINT